MTAFTYLIRLAGPMQSWGTRSRFSIRDTGMEPSKSGVIGLLSAALGRDRGDPVEDLAALAFGVRVDRAGVMKVDYHTAGGTHRANDRYGVIKADGKGRETVQSWRYYLSDAVFTAGLEGPEPLLKNIHAALLAPKRFPLFLGRMSFCPSPPPVITVRPETIPGSPDIPGLVTLPLKQALSKAPYFPRSTRERKRILDQMEDHPLRLRLALEVALHQAAEIRTDTPLNFSQRTFSQRGTVDDFVELSKDLIMEDI